MKRTTLDLIQNEGLRYALYVIMQRAIPNMVDGFKPVHRFFVHSAMKARGDDFKKVASIGGNVAEYGYHHGEESANDAGSALCATWCNNVNLLNGRGFFGSRLVRKPSEARYIYCKLSPEFKKIYQDNDLVPVHDDPEHEPPSYYLPIIPTVLLNGISGIAKAYATNIPSHSLQSLTEGCMAYLKDKPFKLDVQIPAFKGTVQDGVITGLYDMQGKTKLHITEIPPRFDRVGYLEVLNKLKEKGIIVSYNDLSKDDFEYEIVLKREYANSAKHERILKDFKLTENTNPNINVIHEGKLEHFDTAEDLLKAFVDFRLGVYQQRIDKKIRETEEAVSRANARAAFIKHMTENPDSLKGLTRKQAIELISSWEGCSHHAETLVQMNIYHLTTDEIEKLLADLVILIKDLNHWKTTTPDAEYMLDLKDLLKTSKK